jgi:hypothetical protein
MIASCGLDEFRKQEERVQPLIVQRASKAEVVTLLGSNFIYYSKGSGSWGELSKVLDREGPARMGAVRERVQRWPNIMLYSTPDMMTWVFLDGDEKAADLVVGAQ